MQTPIQYTITFTTQLEEQQKTLDGAHLVVRFLDLDQPLEQTLNHHEILSLLLLTRATLHDWN
jgi:hypothetical protein